MRKHTLSFCIITSWHRSTSPSKLPLTTLFHSVVLAVLGGSFCWHHLFHQLVKILASGDLAKQVLPHCRWNTLNSYWLMMTSVSLIWMFLGISSGSSPWLVLTVFTSSEGAITAGILSLPKRHRSSECSKPLPQWTRMWSTLHFYMLNMNFQTSQGRM